MRLLETLLASQLPDGVCSYGAALRGNLEPTALATFAVARSTDAGAHTAAEHGETHLRRAAEQG